MQTIIIINYCLFLGLHLTLLPVGRRAQPAAAPGPARPAEGTGGLFPSRNPKADGDSPTTRPLRGGGERTRTGPEAAEGWTPVQKQAAMPRPTVAACGGGPQTPHPPAPGTVPDPPLGPSVAEGAGSPGFSARCPPRRPRRAGPPPRPAPPAPPTPPPWSRGGARRCPAPEGRPGRAPGAAGRRSRRGYLGPPGASGPGLPLPSPRRRSQAGGGAASAGARRPLAGPGPGAPAAGETPPSRVCPPPPPMPLSGSHSRRAVEGGNHVSAFHTVWISRTHPPRLPLQCSLEGFNGTELPGAQRQGPTCLFSPSPPQSKPESSGNLSPGETPAADAEVS